MDNLTDIAKIGLIKHSGTEQFSLKKEFSLDAMPDLAAIRIDAMGVCGIFINGTFLEAITGRYSNRIGYFECTSLLKKGKNIIELRLGGHYYQPTEDLCRQSFDAHVALAAAQLIINGKELLKTDDTWCCISDDGQCVPYIFGEITCAEYERFWLTAALWREQRQEAIPEAVLTVAGDEYASYVNTSPSKFKAFDNAIKSENISLEDGNISLINKEADGFIIFDLKRIHVGYIRLEYTAKKDESIQLDFDYSESIADLDNEKSISRRLRITEMLYASKACHTVIRRRGARFVKLTLFRGSTAVITDPGFILSTKPHSDLGMFICDDELLNRIWETGKYTLRVNKHQEYESCPRNEMKYFSGDAIIEALVDYYAFGDGELLDPSLALTEIDTNNGIRHDRTQKNVSLWDYPAWRILTYYNHYFYHGDTGFVKKYFNEMVLNLEWLIDKMNSKGLIYQIPCFSVPMYSGLSPIEYNSCTHRLGEKPLLNALLYKCLTVMAELAPLADDSRGEEWALLASKVKDAVNTYLYDAKRKAYLDLFNTSYIPEDGNALAVLFGLCDGDRAQDILNTVKESNWTEHGSSIISTPRPLIRDKERIISPVMNTYEAEARFLSGDSDNALELIRRCWGSMLKKGAGTFWEFVPCNGDFWPIPAHGWASGCTYLLSAYGLGIRPLSPGYESAIFAPSKQLKHFKGVVPTVKGLIAVSLENGEYTVAYPKEIKLTVSADTTVKLIKY